MIEITNTESGEYLNAADEMVPEGTLDMIEAKDKRIAELEAFIRDLDIESPRDFMALRIQKILKSDGGTDD